MSKNSTLIRRIVTGLLKKSIRNIDGIDLEGNTRKLLEVTGLLQLVIVFLISSSCGNQRAIDEPSGPNIIMFLVDDLGWRDVGFMGSTFYETPNIDDLAAQGMVFTNAYANAPNCAPSRACILSGLYPPRHGVYTVGKSDRGKAANRKLVPVKNQTVLNGDFFTIAKRLKQAGYRTCHIGKWHLGNDSLTSPQAQGFDVNIGGNHAGHPKSYFSPYKNQNLNDGPPGEYLTDRLTDEALQFIDESKDDQFFLFLSHYAVHTPLQGKKHQVEKYRGKEILDEQDNATYAAMIESTDESLGRLVNKLQDLGLDKNTLLIFFSDNGGHGGVTSNAPLRGSKGMMYEGGIRVPMIAWWPENIKAGTQCDEPVIGIDFYPTFLDAASIKVADMKPDGKSLLPLFLEDNEAFTRDALYWHFPAYLEGYKTIRHPENLVDGIWRATPSAAIRAGDWKLIEYFDDGRYQLFNLENDPGEQIDLAETHPEKAMELLNKMEDWRQHTMAKMPEKIISDDTGTKKNTP